MAKEVNCCEHGDHPAPPGKRFCSTACATCEQVEGPDLTTGCTGLCRYGAEAAAADIAAAMSIRGRRGRR